MFHLIVNLLVVEIVANVVVVVVVLAKFDLKMKKMKKIDYFVVFPFFQSHSRLKSISE